MRRPANPTSSRAVSAQREKRDAEISKIAARRAQRERERERAAREAEEDAEAERLLFQQKMRAKREGKESADALAPDASPMRMRNANVKSAASLPYVSKAMSAVYFSYESEQLEEGAENEGVGAAEYQAEYGQ